MNFHLDSYLKSIQQGTEQRLSFRGVHTAQELLLRQVTGRDRLRSLLKIAEIPGKLPMLKTELLEPGRPFQGCILQRIALTISEGLSFPDVSSYPGQGRASSLHPSPSSATDMETGAGRHWDWMHRETLSKRRTIISLLLCSYVNWATRLLCRTFWDSATLASLGTPLAGRPMVFYL